MQRIELHEGEERTLGPDLLGSDLVEAVQRIWHPYIRLAPTIGYQAPGFVLKTRGYVGRLVLPGKLELEIVPKVAIGNLLGMLEIAYDLDALRIMDGDSSYAAIDRIFEVLAGVLVHKIHGLVRRGLYRQYITREAMLDHIKGRLIPPLRPGPRQLCQYSEFSADGLENRIILWTLFMLRRYPLQATQLRRVLRGIWQALDREIGLVPCAGEVWDRVQYHRLNRGYQPIHALCRFFVEQCGPLLGQGNRRFSPFMLYMPRLFERFVGAWLRRFLTPAFLLKEQHYTPLAGSAELAFQMDMVLMARANGRALAVLDAKYKATQVPAAEDIQQVVAYAVRLDTQRAYLVYPNRLKEAVDIRVGAIQVKAIGMDLSGNLEQAGRTLGQEIQGVTAAP